MNHKDIPMNGESTLGILRSEHRRIRTHRLLLRLSSVGLSVGIPALVLGLIDKTVVFSEPLSFTLIVGCMAMGTCAFVFVTRRIRKQRIVLKDIALKAETVMPELMDSLICACEMDEAPDRETSPLHHALLEHVDRKIDTSALLKAIRHREPGLLHVTGIWILVLAILAISHYMPIGVKFRSHLADLIKGTSTAISATPGHCEVAAGNELLVKATIHRGPLSGIQIEIESSTGTRRFRMTETDGTSFEFVLYNLKETSTYRIITPTVTSEIYTATVYQKPIFDTIEISITPPVYTGIEQRNLTALNSTRIPQGSRVTISGTGNIPLKAFLQVGSNDVRLFQQSEGNRHTTSFSVVASETYRIFLEDNDGHRLLYDDPWDVEMIEDLSPIINIIDPKKETSVLQEGKDLPISAEVTDDYGVHIVSLAYNINGTGWKRRVLRDNDAPILPLALIVNSLDLNETVEVGDVALFFIEAMDQAEPQRNVSRSGIRFVEIRPKKDPSGPGEGKDKKKEGKKKERLRVSDLIMRLKALIRDLLSASSIHRNGDLADALQSLTGKAADLHLDTNRRYEKLKKKADDQNMGLGLIGDLFIAAVTDLKSGHSLLEKALIFESLGSDQAALANLIKIEIELEKNSKKQQGQGQDKQSTKPNKGKKTSKNQENAQKQQRKKLDVAKQMLADLRELIQRQRLLRERMKELKESDQKTERDYIAKQQQTLADAADDIREKVDTTFPEGGMISQDLSRAKLQMQDAKRKLSTSQPATAEKYAANAEQFLKRAKSGLERLRDALTDTQLKEAIGKLNTLQKRQQQVQNSTSQLAKSPTINRQAAGNLSKGQKELNADYEKLLEDLEKAGAEMEEQKPGSEERIQKAIRAARDKRVSANMKRAANALRYRRPKKAEDHQKQAKAGLKELAESLERIQRGQGQLSTEELTAMLKKTMANMKALQNKPTAKSKNQMIQDLKEMATRIGNKSMKSLSDSAQKIDANNNGGKSAQDLGRILDSSARILERELLKAAMLQKLRFSRAKGQQVPDEYSKLIERYFKALSEEEDE